MVNLRRIIMMLVAVAAGSVGADSIPRDELSIKAVQSRLISLIDKRPLYTASINTDADCAIPIDQLIPQKYWIVDQPGGDLTTKKPTPSIPGSTPATPEQLATDLEAKFPNYVQGSGKVVILVVDDFQTPLKVTQESMTRNITHGGLIDNQLNRMISKLKLQTSVSVDHVFLYNGQDKRITSLARRIQDTINKHKDVQRFVINMSFAQLSCRVLKDYQTWLKGKPSNQGERLTFHEYSKEVFQVSHSYSWDETEGALLSPDFVRMNPLVILKFDVGKEGQLVQVAAAGNYGLHYPLYPAAWPFVIGVSASAEDYRTAAKAYLKKSATTSEMMLWSNWGDVTERGQWFAYVRSGKPALYYYGTSFAAPTASLLMALTLRRSTSSSCAVPDLYSAFPQNGLPLRELLSDQHCLN